LHPFFVVASGVEESPRKDGQKQSDCIDVEDNDNDGNIDCEDAGCENKPAKSSGPVTQCTEYSAYR